MFAMEHAVSFKNAKGHTLHGILHRPEGALHPEAPGVVWLSAGQKDRLGAWRMNLVIARRLARRGVPVLRFDFHGIGDSEGEQPHGQFVMDLYGFIQTGGFKDDAVAGARFLLRETGVKKLVFGGLCGGSISGLFAGPEVPEVFGHVMVDLPVTISSAARQKFLEENPVEMLRTNPVEAETVYLLYLKKLANPEAWKRLLSGESDYKLLTEALRQKVRGAADKVLPSLPEAVRTQVDKVLKPLPPPTPTTAEGSAEPAATASGEVRNEMVPVAFRKLLASGQRLRLLNSSTYHPTFMAYFGDAHVAKDPAERKGYVLTVAENTNHIFSLEHSRAALYGEIDALIDEASGGVLPKPDPLPGAVAVATA